MISTGSCARRCLALVLCLPLAALAAGAQTPVAERPVYTVGIVYDGQPTDAEGFAFERLAGLVDLVVREANSLTRREFDLRFPADKRLSGEWSVSGIRSAVDRLLTDPQVDAVVGVGIFVTNDLCRRRALPKPVIAALAIDIDAQGLPVASNKQGQMTSGVENLNYVITRGSILRDVARFREVVGFRRVHVLADALVGEAIPEIPEAVIEGGRLLGLEMIVVPTVDSAEQALSQLPPDAEAVYVTPLNRLPATEFDRLVSGLIERGLPSFSLWGREEVEIGIMAGVRPATDLTRLSRRMALNLQRIFRGEDAGMLPVELELQGGLVINMATARAIDFYPSFNVAREAELLHPEAAEEFIDRPLTLSEAVKIAVAENLSLASTRRSVAAGAENVRRARSLLKPEIQISGSGLQIDDDRAAASFGLQAERSVTGGISVTQVLYADGLLAQVEVEKNLQRALELAQEIQRLDLALQTSTSFLNVLRAQTLERVARENQRLTQTNLELARKRVQIGFSGPADVYRWRSELATDRDQSNQAHSRVHTAYLNLNRLVHGALEPLYETIEPSLESPELITGFGRLNRFVDNARSFALFREFSVREGLSNSPELQALDAGIAAQERALLAARRSYWVPDVALVGEAERQISKSGAGSTPNPELDRNDWSVALQATLPLFQGGARKARVAQSSEELAALRLERGAVRESIELRIRTALFELSATYLGIELSREAVEAARENLNLVSDTYARGTLSILELLDAQNNALVAEEFASNAVFDFLVDLMELQRATNSFDFFLADAAREGWFERLEAFFAEAGLAPRPQDR